MSRWNIHHTTDLNVPIDVAWKALADLEDWKKWSLWTLLEAPQAKTGTSGKLRACYEGNDEDWQSFDFNFANVDNEDHVLAWQGSVLGGLLFSGKHHMRLTELPGGNSCRSGACGSLWWSSTDARDRAPIQEIGSQLSSHEQCFQRTRREIR